MQEINVENIMQEIRDDIKRKGYTPDMLSFQDVDIPINEGYGYNYDELKSLVHQMDKQCIVAWYRELPGNPIVVFIKKVIRVLVAFIIIPISNEQNSFNGSTTRVIHQLMGYIDEQNEKIKTMEAHISVLEEKTAQLINNKGE